MSWSPTYSGEGPIILLIAFKRVNAFRMFRYIPCKVMAMTFEKRKLCTRQVRIIIKTKTSDGKEVTRLYRSLCYGSPR
jgi:hypothetical protein